MVGVKVLSMLDEMEELLDGLPRVPLTGKVLVSVDRLLEMMDKIRAALPDDVKRAHGLLNDRDRILEAARLESQSVIENASKQVERLVSREEVVRMANAQAQEITVRMEASAREMRAGADAYADQVLGRLEEYLHRVCEEVGSNRKELVESRKTQNAG